MTASPQPEAVPPVIEPAEVRWYYEFSFVLVMLFSFGPLALPLIWWHPKLGRFMKLLISVVTVLLSIAAVWAIIVIFQHTYAQVQEFLRLLRGTG
ncbi:MAG: hypothetical protein ACFBZ8_03915 [Opitutales bacterium]